MSFFDEGDDEPPRRTASEGQAPRPRPRRPAPRGERAPDHQTIMVRRGIALVVVLVVVFLVVFLISRAASSARLNSLKNYNSDVIQIAQDSDQNVGAPYFSTLSRAQGQSAATVRPTLDQLSMRAENDVNRAKGLSVPGEMDTAQNDLVLALQLREEAVTDAADQIPTALGGLNARSAFQRIAGDNGAIYASDVLFAQRVTPLIGQVLSDNDIQPPALPTSRWVQDLNWLNTSVVAQRLRPGIAGTGTNGTALAPGTHGHKLGEVLVDGNVLNSPPSDNNITSGPNPTFVVQVDNDSQNQASDVRVSVSVTAQGKTITAFKVLPSTQPGNTYNVSITVRGVALQVPAKISVAIAPVPGETNTANNSGTFTAVFGS